MGTRSLTVFKNHDGEEIAVMYRQYDGYPTGHGAELKEWADGHVLVNGMRVGRDAPTKIWNGMNCAAAACVSYFKEEPGGIYLHPANKRDLWEDYIYILQPERAVESSNLPGVRLTLQVVSYGDVIYEGLMEDFDPEKIESEENEE